MLCPAAVGWRRVFFFFFFLTSLKFDVASVGSITFFKLQPLKKFFFFLKICISFGNCAKDKYSHLNHLAVFLGRCATFERRVCMQMRRHNLPTILLNPAVVVDGSHLNLFMQMMAIDGRPITGRGRVGSIGGCRMEDAARRPVASERCASLAAERMN